MKLDRIEVRNFRALSGETVVEGLAEGLTVLAGENEEGKSTLLDAVRTVLFERHRVGGQVADSLMPFGSRVRPEIKLDFSIGDQTYSLFKAFCQRPEARLEAPDGVFTGEEAERELEKLLRTRTPGRGASKPEHQGIWGMLWVEQGRGFEPLKMHSTARNTLQSTLQKEVGDVLGGELGGALLEAVLERQAEFLDKRGLARGELKKQRELVVALEDELAHLEVELRTYQAQVDQLGEAKDRREAMSRAGTLDAARRDRDAAKETLDTLTALQRAREESARENEVATANLERCQALYQQRRELIDRVTAHRTSEEEHVVAVRALRKQLAPLEAAVRDKERARGAEQEALKATLVRLDEAEQEGELAQAQVRLKALKRRSRVARKHLKTVKELRDKASALPIDETQLQTLRDTESHLRTAKARLEASAATVTLHLERSARLNGEPVTMGEPVQVTAPSTIEIAGVGTIDVAPGGEDLEDRKHAYEQARVDYQAMLTELRIDTLNQAIAVHAERRSYEAEAVLAEQLAQFEAPEGQTRLTETIAALGDEVQALLEATGLEHAPDPQSAELTLRQLVVARKRRTDALASAEAGLEEAKATRDTLRDKLIASEAHLQAVTAQRKQFEEQLAAAHKERPDEAVHQAFVEATGQLGAARDRLKLSEQAWRDAEPEAKQAALSHAQEAFQKAQREVKQLDQTIHDARIQLRASGRTGLGERHLELTAKCDEARMLLRKLERDARSAALLARVLLGSAERAKKEFLEPVRKRVHPYLESLIPDAELQIDAELRIVGLTRDSRQEPFESLSVGTREQLAVLTRLAFADILRDDGQAAPVLLDDALVYSDDERFARMKSILNEASRNQQVLVFTCRERDWQDIGASMIKLSDCRH